MSRVDDLVMRLEFLFNIPKQISLGTGVQEKAWFVQEQDKRLAPFTLLRKPSQEGKEPNKTPRTRAETDSRLVSGVVNVSPEIGTLSHTLRVASQCRPDIESDRQILIL